MGARRSAIWCVDRFLLGLILLLILSTERFYGANAFIQQWVDLGVEQRVTKNVSTTQLGAATTILSIRVQGTLSVVASNVENSVDSVFVQFVEALSTPFPSQNRQGESGGAAFLPWNISVALPSSNLAASSVAVIPLIGMSTSSALCKSKPDSSKGALLPCAVFAMNLKKPQSYWIADSLTGDIITSSESVTAQQLPFSCTEALPCTVRTPDPSLSEGVGGCSSLATVSDTLVVVLWNGTRYAFRPTRYFNPTATPHSSPSVRVAPLMHAFPSPMGWSPNVAFDGGLQFLELGGDLKTFLGGEYRRPMCVMALVNGTDGAAQQEKGAVIAGKAQLFDVNVEDESDQSLTGLFKIGEVAAVNVTTTASAAGQRAADQPSCLFPSVGSGPFTRFSLDQTTVYTTQFVSLVCTNGIGSLYEVVNYGKDNFGAIKWSYRIQPLGGFSMPMRVGIQQPVIADVSVTHLHFYAAKGWEYAIVSRYVTCIAVSTREDGGEDQQIALQTFISNEDAKPFFSDWYETNLTDRAVSDAVIVSSSGDQPRSKALGGLGWRSADVLPATVRCESAKICPSVDPLVSACQWLARFGTAYSVVYGDASMVLISPISGAPILNQPRVSVSGEAFEGGVVFKGPSSLSHQLRANDASFPATFTRLPSVRRSDSTAITTIGQLSVRSAADNAATTALLTMSNSSSTIEVPYILVPKSLVRAGTSKWSWVENEGAADIFAPTPAGAVHEVPFEASDVAVLATNASVLAVISSQQRGSRLVQFSALPSVVSFQPNLQLFPTAAASMHAASQRGSFGAAAPDMYAASTLPSTEFYPIILSCMQSLSNGKITAMDMSMGDDVDSSDEETTNSKRASWTFVLPTEHFCASAAANSKERVGSNDTTTSATTSDFLMSRDLSIVYVSTVMKSASSTVISSFSIMALNASTGALLGNSTVERKALLSTANTAAADDASSIRLGPLLEVSRTAPQHNASFGSRYAFLSTGASSPPVAGVVAPIVGTACLLSLSAFAPVTVDSNGNPLGPTAYEAKNTNTSLLAFTGALFKLTGVKPRYASHAFAGEASIAATSAGAPTTLAAMFSNRSSSAKGKRFSSRSALATKGDLFVFDLSTLWAQVAPQVGPAACQPTWRGFPPQRIPSQSAGCVGGYGGAGALPLISAMLYPAAVIDNVASHITANEFIAALKVVGGSETSASIQVSLSTARGELFAASNSVDVPASALGGSSSKLFPVLHFSSAYAMAISFGASLSVCVAVGQVYCVDVPSGGQATVVRAIELLPLPANAAGSSSSDLLSGCYGPPIIGNGVLVWVAQGAEPLVYEVASRRIVWRWSSDSAFVQIISDKSCSDAFVSNDVLVMLCHYVADVDAGKRITLVNLQTGSVFFAYGPSTLANGNASSSASMSYVLPPSGRHLDVFTVTSGGTLWTRIGFESVSVSAISVPAVSVCGSDADNTYVMSFGNPSKLVGSNASALKVGDTVLAIYATKTPFNSTKSIASDSLKLVNTFMTASIPSVLDVKSGPNGQAGKLISFGRSLEISSAVYYPIFFGLMPEVAAILSKIGSSVLLNLDTITLTDGQGVRSFMSASQCSAGDCRAGECPTVCALDNRNGQQVKLISHADTIEIIPKFYGNKKFDPLWGVNDTTYYSGNVSLNVARFVSMYSYLQIIPCQENRTETTANAVATTHSPTKTTASVSALSGLRVCNAAQGDSWIVLEIGGAEQNGKVYAANFRTSSFTTNAAILAGNALYRGYSVFSNTSIFTVSLSGNSNTTAVGLALFLKLNLENLLPTRLPTSAALITSVLNVTLNPNPLSSQSSLFDNTLEVMTDGGPITFSESQCKASVRDVPMCAPSLEMFDPSTEADASIGTVIWETDARQLGTASNWGKGYVAVNYPVTLGHIMRQYVNRAAERSNADASSPRPVECLLDNSVSSSSSAALVGDAGMCVSPCQPTTSCDSLFASAAKRFVYGASWLPRGSELRAAAAGGGFALGGSCAAFSQRLVNNSSRPDDNVIVIDFPIRFNVAKQSGKVVLTIPPLIVDGYSGGEKVKSEAEANGTAMHNRQLEWDRDEKGRVVLTEEEALALLGVTFSTSHCYFYGMVDIVAEPYGWLAICAVKSLIFTIAFHFIEERLMGFERRRNARRLKMDRIEARIKQLRAKLLKSESSTVDVAGGGANSALLTSGVTADSLNRLEKQNNPDVVVDATAKGRDDSKRQHAGSLIGSEARTIREDEGDVDTDSVRGFSNAHKTTNTQSAQIREKIASLEEDLGTIRAESKVGCLHIPLSCGIASSFARVVSFFAFIDDATPSTVQAAFKRMVRENVLPFAPNDADLEEILKGILFDDRTQSKDFTEEETKFRRSLIGPFATHYQWEMCNNRRWVVRRSIRDIYEAPLPLSTADDHNDPDAHDGTSQPHSPQRVHQLLQQQLDEVHSSLREVFDAFCEGHKLVEEEFAATISAAATLPRQEEDEGKERDVASKDGSSASKHRVLIIDRKHYSNKLRRRSQRDSSASASSRPAVTSNATLTSSASPNSMHTRLAADASVNRNSAHTLGESDAADQQSPLLSPPPEQHQSDKDSSLEEDSKFDFETPLFLEKVSAFNALHATYPNAFKFMLLPCRAVDAVLQPSTIQQTLTLIQSFLTILTYIVEVLIRSRGMGFGFLKIYQCVFFITFNSALPATLLVNAVFHTDLGNGGNAFPTVWAQVKNVLQNPLMMASYLLIIAPIVTHVLPGLLLFGWVTLPLLFVPIAIEYFIASRNQHRQTRTMLFIMMGARVLTLFGVSCALSIAFNASDSFIWEHIHFKSVRDTPYYYDTGSYVQQPYWEALVQDFNSRSFACVWEGYRATISRFLQMGFFLV